MAVGTTMAIIGIAAAAGSTTSAVVKTKAANKAAKLQTAAAQDANRVATQVYNEGRAMTAPYQIGGANSMGLLSALMTPQGQPGAYSPGMRYQPNIGINPRPPMSPATMPASFWQKAQMPIGGGPPPPDAGPVPMMPPQPIVGQPYIGGPLGPNPIWRY